MVAFYPVYSHTITFPPSSLFVFSCKHTCRCIIKSGHEATTLLNVRCIPNSHENDETVRATALRRRRCFSIRCAISPPFS